LIRTLNQKTAVVLPKKFKKFVEIDWDTPKANKYSELMRIYLDA